MKPHLFHPEAESEFLAALTLYTEESQELGRRYYHAIHALVGDVCRSPMVHRRMPHAKEVRRHFGKQFPYAVLYVDESDHVLILAAAHFKRRPGYWRHRLKKR